MAKKITRYAVVGTGGRCTTFIDPLVTRFNKNNELVALCDTNQGRMDWHNQRLVGELSYHAVPTYLATDFDKMVREAKPDVVIVTTIDAYHHQYIIRAMELGCDVVTEKPMTIDDKKCRAIFATQEKTGKKLRVTFNYRWAPGPTKVKQLLSEGIIGEILHTDMEYLLNTSHGADYFRRWHREKDKSGGLMVHKSTHHFDLVNWWIDAVPQTVFGFGRLAFYGAENAKKRGVKVKSPRYTGQDNKNDPFALTLDSNKGLKGLYLDNEKYDGYIRDRNVFGENITVEDTMSVLVKYKTGVTLNYSLNAYLPREGFHIVFNGTKGRLEYWENHADHIIGKVSDKKSPEESLSHRIVVHPLFEQRYDVEVPVAAGSHGGSDEVLVEQIFSPKPPKEKFGRNAGAGQGAASILIGIAANKCFKSGKPVQIGSLLPQIAGAVHLHELE